MSKLLCNTTFTKEDLFRFIKEAVKYSPIPKGKPKDVKCKRLNTFVMPTSQRDLKLENFGVNVFKNRSKNYYFQRGKDKFPALILSELPGYEVREEGRKLDCCKFQIGILDTLIENCNNNCGYCGDRTEHDIYKDAKELWNKVCNYLELICSARPYKLEKTKFEGEIVSTGKKNYTKETFDWVSKPVADKLVKDGIIDGYDVHEGITNKWKKQLWINNKRAPVNQWHFPKNYYGIWTEITICVNLECVEYDWNLEEFKKEIHVECC